MFCKGIAKNFNPTIYWEELSTRWYGEYSSLNSHRRPRVVLSCPRMAEMKALETEFNKYLYALWRSRNIKY